MAKDVNELDKLITELQSKYPNGTIMDFSNGDNLPEVDRVPIENPSIGQLFGFSGCPIGRIIEIYGGESSGKTSLCEYIAGQYQKYDFPVIDKKTGELKVDKNGNPVSRKGVVVYIDAENAIDLSYAKIHGLDTNQVKLVQPDTGEEALDIAQTFAESGLVDLIVIDSIAALSPQAEIEADMDQVTIGLQARMLSKFFRKVKSFLSKNGCTLLCINQTRAKIGGFNPTGAPAEDTAGGKALKFYASIRIETKRREYIMDKDEVKGIVISAKTVKNKTAPPMIKKLLNMSYEKSFDPTTEWVEVAIDKGIIEMGGAGFAELPLPDGTKMKMRGKNNIIEYCLDPENKEVYEYLKEKCKQVLYDPNKSFRVSVDDPEDDPLKDEESIEV